MQITCNACYTYDIPTESKLPVPVDLDFFYTFAGYSIYRCSMMTVVQISLIYLLGPHFRFAQIRLMTLAVCVSVIFFSNFNEVIFYIPIVIH